MSPLAAPALAVENPASAEIGPRSAHFLRSSLPRPQAKHLMRLLGISTTRADQLLAGARPTSEQLERLGRHFGWSYVSFAFGGVVSAPLAAPSPDAPRAAWATDQGMVHEAPAGHEDFARRALNLTQHIGGDVAAYAMRTLGWIALTETGGRVDLRYHQAAIDGRAALATIDRLRSLGAVAVRRSVCTGDRWLEAEHTVSSAIVALERAAHIAAAPRLGWSVERHPLQAATDTGMRMLLGALAEVTPQPGYLAGLADRMSLLGECSILRAHQDRVTSLWIGPKLGVDRSGMGKDLRERADLAYAEIIERRVREAAEAGMPTLYRLAGPIDGQPFDWESLAIAEPPAADGTRLVMTKTRIIAGMAA